MNFASIRKRLSRLNWPPPRSDGRSELGSRGERAAATFLKRKHLRIIARNFRCHSGEIDLICEAGSSLVFVEVRSRSPSDFQEPTDLIGPAKWSRVERAARFYLTKNGRADKDYRFDLVTVMWQEKGGPLIEHFENAYQARLP